MEVLTKSGRGLYDFSDGLATHKHSYVATQSDIIVKELRCRRKYLVAAKMPHRCNKFKAL